MKQSVHTLKTQVTRTLHLNYLLSLPRGYETESGARWPVILFLHGIGERGIHPESLKKHGIPKVVEEGKELPFITVSPQCPPRTTWGDHIAALDALLHEVVATYMVDTARSYLTGLSMGGYGTWRLATLYPNRFAAIAPICGGGSVAYGFPQRVCVLKDVPVWVFHGAQDTTVPLRESEVLVKTLRRCGGKVRFTVYPEAGHDSWTETYNNPALYTWFLEHRRKEEEK
ncbi:MAG: prolyl oligopeptidase family serine peptidase [Chloroflexota bacterium]|nr:prolyl oligopeptidase family serine peptidase [Chloroflexota bacterium]